VARADVNLLAIVAPSAFRDCDRWRVSLSWFHRCMLEDTRSLATSTIKGKTNNTFRSCIILANTDTNDMTKRALTVLSFLL